jgi:hypothetical protein
MSAAPITKTEADRMIAAARWVSARDIDELLVEMPTGERFLIGYPTGERPTIMKVEAP